MPDFRRARVAFVVAAILVFSGAAGLALAGSGWGGSPRWFGPDTPLGVTRVRPGLSHLASSLGLLCLVLGWLVVGALVRAGRVGVRSVAAVALAGAVPLALGPPLFSSDARSYVAVGELVDSGGDPYTQGWGALGRPDYVGQAANFWKDTPSPYSPGALRLLQAVARLAGGNLDRGAVVLRVLAVAALLVLGVLVVHLSRRIGGSPAAALWLAVANPVVLIGGVSGAHLDVLVAPLALAAAGLLVARRPVLAGVSLGLAAQLKVTALVILAMAVAWAVFRDRTGAARRSAVVAVIAAMASFVLVSLLCGLGWGWLSSLGVPGQANTSATPIDAVADLAYHAGLGSRVGIQSVSGASPGLQAVALAVAAVLCLTVVVALRQLGPIEAAGWAVLVVLLLAGALWSWYLIVPLALIAVTASRRSLSWSWPGLVVVGSALFFGARPGGSPSPAVLRGTADLEFLLAYGLGGALIVVGFVRDRDRARPARPDSVSASPTGSGGGAATGAGP